MPCRRAERPWWEPLRVQGYAPQDAPPSGVFLRCIDNFRTAFREGLRKRPAPQHPVAAHVGSVFAKLGLRDRAAAVIFALRHGLADLSPPDGESPAFGRGCTWRGSRCSIVC